MDGTMKVLKLMMFLFFAALMIVSLTERNIRANMAGVLPILPAGMKTTLPTWENIRYFFRNVHQIAVTAGGRVLKTCMKGMTKMHEQLLKLLEAPRSAYEGLGHNFGCLHFTINPYNSNG